MNKSLACSLQSLRSVQAFLDANAERLPTVASCGARRRLDELVTTAGAQAAEQSAADLDAQIATRRLHALRTSLLHDHMAPIAAIAAVETLSIPDLAPLRMPPRWASPELLRAHAAGMALAAAPFAGIFLAAGLGDDFVERLEAAGDDMLAAVGERTQRLAARIGATRGLAETVRTGRLVVHALDRMVRREIRGDAVLLAEWNSARRVERARVANRAAALPAPVQPVALLPAVSSASEPVPVEAVGDATFALLRLRVGRLGRLLGRGAGDVSRSR